MAKVKTDSILKDAPQGNSATIDWHGAYFDLEDKLLDLRRAILIADAGVRDEIDISTEDMNEVTGFATGLALEIINNLIKKYYAPFKGGMI